MTAEIRDNGQLDWSHFLAVEEGNDVTIPPSDRRLDRHAAQWIWHGLSVVIPGSAAGVAGVAARVRRFYQPHLERLYDNARTRLADLDQIERLADAAPSRERFLSDLTLDPPESAGALAGPPHLDEDFLILSTIHSAKGQEWDTVYVLSVADGCIPSDLATGRADEIEEERRLLYVAMTRAKNTLCMIHPLRFFIRQQSRHGDRHVYTPRSRFLPESVLGHFDQFAPTQRLQEMPDAAVTSRVDMAGHLRALWR